MPLPIMWAPVWQKAAEALAESLGKRIGEELGGAAGKAVAALIFGGTDDAGAAAWRAEVDARLMRIEQKLDSVIDFFQHELPALVYEKTTEAILDQRVNDIKAARVTLTATLIAYANNPTESNRNALRTAADRIVELGYSLAQNGPAWHAASIVAFTAATSGYSRLVADDPTLAESFQHYVDAYSAVVEPWLNTAIAHSLVAVQLTRQGEYGKAEHIIGQLPPNQGPGFSDPKFLLGFWYGPGKEGEYKSPPRVHDWGFDGPADCWWGMPGWLVRHGNTWTGDWGHGRERYAYFPAGTQMTPQLFVSNMHPKGLASYPPPWIVLDFVDVPRANLDKDILHHQFGTILGIVTDAQRKLDSYPPQLSELAAAVPATQGLLTACQCIKSLPELAT